MNLLVLMYPRVGTTGKRVNCKEEWADHFAWLQQYPVLLPGEPLVPSALCLSFDDATYAFYHHVFPLLKRFGLRALLGVPVRYILETTTESAERRLAVPHGLAMQDGWFEERASFCTWKELEEMARSGHVEVASLSHMHGNLTFPFINLEREIVYSKRLLEERLPQAISSFIYPFGRYTSPIHHYVARHYPYAFCTGSALNFSWNASKHPLARIRVDNLSCRFIPFHSCTSDYNFSKM